MDYIRETWNHQKILQFQTMKHTFFVVQELLPWHCPQQVSEQIVNGKAIRWNYIIKVKTARDFPWENRSDFNNGAPTLGPVHTYPQIFVPANFFYADTPSVHTCPPYTLGVSRDFCIRSPEWKFLYTLCIRIRVDARIRIFLISYLTTFLNFIPSSSVKGQAHVVLMWTPSRQFSLRYV